MKKPKKRKFRCGKCGMVVNEIAKIRKKKEICRTCWDRYKWKWEGFRE